MTENEALLEIEEIRQHLEGVSFVAHRDSTEVLPTVQERFGAEAALHWLEHARDLFFHDREAGKAFIRNTEQAVAACGCLDWVEQAAAFLRWRGSDKALEAFMPQVGEVYAELGPEGERIWFEIGVRWLERHLDSGTSYFRTPWRDLAGGKGAAGMEELLAPAEKLFQERRVALGSYITGALRVRDLVGPEGLDQWARRGADILQASRQRGEAYFRLESAESVGLLLEAVPGYRVRDHARLLQMLQTAWFGRAHPFAESEWIPGAGRPLADTDGEAIYLPAVFPSRDEALLAVLHVAGHIELGTYDRGAIEALFREAGMAHPPLEDDQRITWRPLYAAYGDELFRFQLLFDLCEDLRVDSALDRVLPGHLRRLEALAGRGEAPEGAAAPYWHLALESVRGALGTAELDERLRPLLSPEAALLDAFRVANRLYAEEADLPTPDIGDRDRAYLPGRGPNASRPVYPRSLGEEDEDPSASDGLEDSRGEESERQEEQEGGETQEDPDWSMPPEETGGSGGRIGAGINTATTVSGRRRQRRADQVGIGYPEWDYRDQDYKPDWAWVQEKALAESDADGAAELLAAHGDTLTRLKRALEMQKPQRPAPLRRQLDGEELDVEAAMDFVTEKRAGNAPEPYVYQHRARVERDTAVLLLADLSTSIMAPCQSGEGRVVDRLRAGMLLFAEALDALGDPFALAGFASKYRDGVSYYPIKGFEGSLNAEVRGTIAGINGRLATRMGAAIRHACRRFAGVRAERRLLLLLSDGRPADYDDGGDPRYLHEDTRMAVKEAASQGIHPFCLTLDPSGADYLPAIFGPGHYLVVDRVDELPRRLPEVYLRLRAA
ncbi:nitric oxide reductase activation protein NorD [Thiohalorhabdus methylotrophus]|uniref:Nitric oxide reductase activation protein NorD n=1 Tax=Thiohalorhabdus methylotrophus TaxID=3242694 RepID=A0ABV4TX21_9GAMM